VGYRLSKIVTKTGDSGKTGMADGSRISKGHLLVEAIGSVDETISALGLTISTILTQHNSDKLLCSMTAYLQTAQHRLFDLGGELTWPEGQSLQEEDVDDIEKWIGHLNESLPPLKNFILPGGNPAAAQCHMARAICRRTERDLVRLHEANNIRPLLLKFINRLSDLLFIAARQLARSCGDQEVIWHQKK